MFLLVKCKVIFFCYRSHDRWLTNSVVVRAVYKGYVCMTYVKYKRCNI